MPNTSDRARPAAVANAYLPDPSGDPDNPFNLASSVIDMALLNEIQCSGGATLRLSDIYRKVTLPEATGTQGA